MPFSAGTRKNSISGVGTMDASGTSPWDAAALNKNAAAAASSAVVSPNYYFGGTTSGGEETDGTVGADVMDNDEVRALAVRLAPALEEADALISTSIPDEFRRQSGAGGDADEGYYGADEDDGIDEEVQALHLSEQLLRQELDMASDFSNFFRSPGRVDEQEQEGDDGRSSGSAVGDAVGDGGDAADGAVHDLIAMSYSVESPASATGGTGGSTTEADIHPSDHRHEEDALDGGRGEGTSQAVSPPSTTSPSTGAGEGGKTGSALLEPIKIPSHQQQAKNPASTSSPTVALLKTPAAASAERPSGANTPDLDQLLYVTPATAAQLASSSASSPGTSPQHQQQQGVGEQRCPQSYTTSDHARHLGLKLEDSTWYSLGLQRRHLLGAGSGGVAGGAEGGGAESGDNNDTHTFCHEYCLTLPESKLKHLCLGLQEVRPQQQHQHQHQASSSEETATITATVVTTTSTSAPSSSSPPRTKVLPPTTPPRPPTASAAATAAVASTASGGAVMRRASPGSASKRAAAGTPASASSSPAKQQAASVAEPPQMLPVRTVSIRIRPDVLCGAVMDAIQHSLMDNLNDLSSTGDGFDGDDDDDDDDDGIDGISDEGGGAALHPETVRILKRQGGHFQAVVEPRKYQQQMQPPASPASSTREMSPGRNAGADGSPARGEPAELAAGAAATATEAPFFLDAQLCTYKSDFCERILLIRVYHHPSSGDGSTSTKTAAAAAVASPSSGTRSPSTPAPTAETSSAAGSVDDQAVDDSFQIVSNLDPERDRAVTALEASNHLREACALIQRMEAPQTAKRIRISFSTGPSGTPAVRTLSDVQEAVSRHLLSHYRACPSVAVGGLTLPSLNSNDWPVVQSCWPTLTQIFDELESRDLTYSSLQWSRFGSFPSLPTLDVHYCSQLRQLSRQDMIVQLLKSASELEEYARKAEYACANMISLLHPTFETYGIDAPSLPKATPLTAYPLDFVAPQQSCPPWGRAVLEALNEIQARSGNKNDADDDPLGTLRLGDAEERRRAAFSAEAAHESLEMAGSAVQMVLKAFQRQYDEEKGARLGRKNAQVMDRLAKMQQHEHLTILALDRSFQNSDKAMNAAREFESKSGGIFQVPLLKWSIVVGGSTGTCWVTSNHILFVTQLIPIIGGSKTTIFELQDVEFTVVQEGPSTLLNPLPTVISISQDGSQLYSFRPSMGGSRLKSFLEIVQRTNLEDPVFVPGDFIVDNAVQPGQV